MFEQSHSSYPSYIERGGEQTYSPPYMAQGAKLYSFLLQANRKSLQALCDKYLNQPTGGITNYQPVLPYVFLVFADIEREYSMQEPDRQRGWMPEINVAFWILTASSKQVGGVQIPVHFAWFMPYIFVDNIFTLISGREVFGFHKALGQFVLPPFQKHADFFAADTATVARFSSQAKIAWNHLLEVRRVDRSDKNPYLPRWHDLSEASSQIGQLLARQTGGLLGSTWEQMINLLKVMNFATSPIVFLKQFRDVRDTHLACYQAIVETSIKFHDFRSGGFLAGDYELTLNHFDSHPIAQELGLTVGNQKIVAAFWFDLDFAIEPGLEVWKSSDRADKLKNTDKAINTANGKSRSFIRNAVSKLFHSSSP
ncbi:MAG: acetoacetate decarboxylase family protein [Pseudanabaena sp. CRU_2_10]|nr:acetoacetate decarboxylase family protein [Pseudanabaena sp. CRU_2_10]